MDTAFHDLPVSAFPFKIEFIDRAGTVVHTIVVNGPGAVHIPALSERYGPVGVRLTYADGHAEDYPPPPQNG